MIAIQINFPARIATQFGECAGDYSVKECQWWVGTEGELYPSATLPQGADVVETPVRFCGGGAWTVRHAEAEAAKASAHAAERRALAKDSFRQYADRKIAVLRAFPPQPHLAGMGYTPAEIRQMTIAEIADLEA